MPALANNTAEPSSSPGEMMLSKLKANGSSGGDSANGVPQQNGKVVVESFVHKHLGAPYEPPLSPEDPDWALHVPASTVNDKDKGTADAWIPRDPRILRLTGRHPLNCEPPMHDLMAAGFITPPSIHYVRNHGPAPKIRWDQHRLEIGGLVERPMSLTMDEIVSMPSVTIPVTMVCAGNRRKEENMLKKSIGFNWGPCAVSTGYWTGVKLCDLLKHVGAKGPKQGGGYHVGFSGPKGELPAGDGTYGTSIPWGKAMNPAEDVLVAYKHNGRWLTIDHGFPVRTIIPGNIGGRTIKWLCKITVQEKESNNHYHYMDNRVLPAHVDQEIATKEGWWFKPEYIINDLNINSAVARPWHDEVVSFKDAKKMYTVKGYAYAGGGHKIIRCEISLDGAQTWRLANIRRFAEPNEYGKHWCWVHWDIDVPIFDFFGPREMLLRAWDETQNTQPATITWNVMGMMNNCHFRVLLHPFMDDKGNVGVRFQHPAPVEVGERGNIGWREEENLRMQALEAAGITTKEGPLPPNRDIAAAAAAKPATPKATGSGKEYTMEEVAQHTTHDSAWFVHEGKVYDATAFLDEHPGGSDSILTATGADATEDFNAIHSKKARNMLADYYIGELVASKPGAPPQPQANGHATANGHTSLITLNPREKVTLKLAERIEVSHNTRIFRFALPSPEHILGLPTGKHLFVYAHVNGELVARAYTPISSDEDKGRLDLLIKVYGPNQHPAFPQGGKMSQHLDKLKIGETIQVKGPVGHFTYEGKGNYVNGKSKGKASKLSMLAGGTGITPILQVLEAIFRDKEDQTCMSLIFANNSEPDILARDRLDKLAQENPERFKVYHVLSKAPEGWPQGKGYVTEHMMRERFFPPGEDSLALMCGPPGLISLVGGPGFEKMGYSKERTVSF
uniref:Nitrate reductase n=1 Tax=Dunaliella viridis TaxID=140095 RepID=Q5J0W6_9CHLO|nr:nitrate reductase [Dunaliella viridis]